MCSSGKVAEELCVTPSINDVERINRGESFNDVEITCCQQKIPKYFQEALHSVKFKALLLRILEMIHLKVKTGYDMATYVLQWQFWQSLWQHSWIFQTLNTPKHTIRH